MHAYKYPPVHTGPQHRAADPASFRTRLHKGNKRIKMFCSKCVIPLLAFYLSLEEMDAAVLPRNKREVSWLDQELFPRLPDRSDQGDLSVGDAGDTGKDVRESSLAPTEHLSLQQQPQNQYQYNRKINEKRRKVAPLDSIGGFQMSSLRNPKDQPDNYWEDYIE